MKNFIVILILIVSVNATAQNENGKFKGVFYGVDSPYGFEDSLHFNKNKLIVKVHPAMSFGTVHIYTYKVSYKEDNILYFKQIKHRSRPRRHKGSGTPGYFDKKHIQLEQLENGNLVLKKMYKTGVDLELRFIPSVEKLD